MPLPKRSKLISKRFSKKPRPVLRPAPDFDSCQQPWPPHPLREWKIRVVCNDPDATDDSSSDEASPSPSLLPFSPPSRKRLIREFSLPLPSPPSPPFTPQTRRSHRGSRSLFPDLAEVDALAVPAASGDVCCPSPPVQTSPAEAADSEVEFARFLREFLPVQEEGSLWEVDASRSQSLEEGGGLGEMLDLELDSEALSWINSLQRLP